LFGFQILIIAKPRPTLETLLVQAKTSADGKIIEIQRSQIRKPRHEQIVDYH